MVRVHGQGLRLSSEPTELIDFSQCTRCVETGHPMILVFVLFFECSYSSPLGLSNFWPVFDFLIIILCEAGLAPDASGDYFHSYMETDHPAADGTFLCGDHG